MLLLETRQGRRVFRRWEVAVIALAICGLTISVATRTFRVKYSTATTVQSVSEQAIRQHMDSDGASWAPPVATLTYVLQMPVFYPRVAPAGPPLPRSYYEEGLFNRPPPLHS